MKYSFLFRLPPVVFGLFLLSAADHPPPTATVASFGKVAVAPSSSCALDPAFEPVHHTARRHLVYLFDGLAEAANVNAAAYSIELIRDRRGHRTINAMTCTKSQLIWLSVKAWEELHDHEPALALLMAHELAHGNSRSPFLIRSDRMLATERHLLETLTYRQQWEVAADQLAADIMLAAGYSRQQILSGARYILSRDGANHLLPASLSHPAGWDRVALLGYYLGRRAMGG